MKTTAAQQNINKISDRKDEEGRGGVEKRIYSPPPLPLGTLPHT
jgi:hypothetical protein